MKHPKNKERLEEYLQGLIEGKYTLRQVATFTGYTTQHLSKLKGEYKKNGPACLINGHRGKPVKTAIPEDQKKLIVSIYLKEYVDGEERANFTYFQKELARKHGILISWPALTRILNEAGIYSPASRKAPVKKASHRPKPRNTSEGELVQIDASTFAWLKLCGDDALYALHGAIDDATGKVLALYLCKAECAFGYYKVLEQIIRNGGLPVEIMSDRSTIFCAAKGKDPPETQWQRIIFKLGIGHRLAFTAQAKGRIERLWQTLQNRLIWELKNAGVKTLQDANRALEEFIPAFNAEFALKVERPGIWREPPEGWESEICSRFPRRVSRAGVLSFLGRKFIIKEDAACGQRLDVCVYAGGIAACFKGSYYPLELLEDFMYPPHAPQCLQEVIDRCLLVDSTMVDKGQPRPPRQPPIRA